jgi:hypothetical protein
LVAPCTAIKCRKQTQVMSISWFGLSSSDCNKKWTITVYISRFIGFQVNIPYKPSFLLAKFEDATHFLESLNIITLLLMCKVLTDKQYLSFFCRYFRTGYDDLCNCKGNYDRKTSKCNIPGHFFNSEHSPYLFPMFNFKKHRSMHCELLSNQLYRTPEILK